MEDKSAPSVSEAPSTSKIKRNNVKAMQLGNATVLKQQMATALSSNQSPAYRKAFIDTLEKKGYDRGELESFADKVSGLKQLEQERSDAAGQSVVEKYDPRIQSGIPVVDEYLNEQGELLDRSVDKVGKALKSITRNLAYVPGDAPKTVLEKTADLGKDATKLTAGTASGLFALANSGLPAMVGFNAALKTVEKLPEEVKANLMFSSPEKDTKELAEDFDATVSLPFTWATQLAEKVGYAPESGSFGEDALEVLNLAGIPLAHKAMGGKGPKNVEELNTFYDKLSKGEATEMELQDYQEFTKKLQNLTVEEVKAEAERKLDEIPVEHNELQDRLANLEADQAKLPDADKAILQPEIDAVKQELASKNEAEVLSYLDEANSQGTIFEINDQIGQLEAKKEGLSPEGQKVIDDNINQLKSQANAIQEQEASRLVQRPQEGTGTTGSERGSLEQGIEGVKTPEKSQEKVIFKEDEAFDGKDYSKGKTSETIAREKGLEFTTEDEIVRHIAEESQNPLELASEYVKLDKDTPAKDFKEQILDEANIKITDEEFDRYIDPNKRSATLALRFFDNNRKVPLDTKLQELSDQHGVEITPEDFGNYLDNIDKGRFTPKDTSIKTKFKNRFQELTGKDLTPKMARAMLEAEAKKINKDYEKFIEREYRTYEEAEQAYYDAIKSGELVVEGNEIVGDGKRSETAPEGDGSKEVGISIEEVEKQRKDLGLEDLPPIDKNIPSHTWEALNAEANRLVDSGEVDFRKLAKDVVEGNVKTSDLEKTILNRGAVEIGKELESSRAELNSAKANGDKVVEQAASDKYLQNLSDLNDIHNALSVAGTEAGRNLAAMKQSMKEDYSIGSLYTRFKKANGDNPLPKELIERLDNYAVQIEELNSKIKEQEDLLKKQGVDIEELKSQKLSTKERIKKVREKRSNLFDEWKASRDAGAGPVKQGLPFGDKDVEFIAKIAVTYLEEGILTTMQVSDKLRKDVKKAMGLKIEDADMSKILDSEVNGKRVRDYYINDGITELKIKKAQVERKVRNEEAALEFANKSKSDKIKEGVANVMGVPRSLMASFDFSAPLRQGLVASVAHPISAMKATKEMFKQFASTDAFEKWLVEYKESPDYELAKKSELYVAEPQELKLNGREEEFMSNLAERIPMIGAAVKASERGYVGYLNKLRTDIFKNGAELLKDQGKTFESHPEEYKALADFINNSAGRGKIANKTLEDAAPLLNATFFSPRLIASRINLLNPGKYATMPPAARMMAVKDMAKFVAFSLSILGLAKMAGADVEEDPRSSDFGKIKVGDTRYDVLGGLGQYIHFAAKELTGKKKTQSGILDLTLPNYSGSNRGSELLKFARQKTSPATSFVIDFLDGETSIGEPFNLNEAILSRLTPLQVQSAVEAYNYPNGGGMGLVMATVFPSMFGIGVQTYSNKKTPEQRRKDREFDLEVKRKRRENRLNLE